MGVESTDVEVRVEALNSPREQRVLLANASWQTYERLVAEREERRSPRFFYDRGVLEIVSPSAEHDVTSRIFAVLVELLAEEADTDIENAGSTTYKREDLARGFEPDECFYFGGNAARVRELVRDKGNIEFDAGDPPPDLVLEVDITSPSLNKLPIYARLGVTEVWRHDGERFSDLRDGRRKRRVRRGARERIPARGHRRGPHPARRRRPHAGSPNLEARRA